MSRCARSRPSSIASKRPCSRLPSAASSRIPPSPSSMSPDTPTPSDPAAGLPGGGFGGLGDPADELKNKGMPWPAYLAIGIVILAGLAFVGVRSYQNRQKLKLHTAFMENYMEFEKNQVGAFWKCLF